MQTPTDELLMSTLNFGGTRQEVHCVSMMFVFVCIHRDDVRSHHKWPLEMQEEMQSVAVQVCSDHPGCMLMSRLREGGCRVDDISEGQTGAGRVKLMMH